MGSLRFSVHRELKQIGQKVQMWFVIIGGILGQNLKNRSRLSNLVRTSLDPKWSAESIYAIARSYRQVILYDN